MTTFSASVPNLPRNLKKSRLVGNTILRLTFNRRLSAQAGLRLEVSNS